MTSKFDYIYGALGVHPEAADYTPEDFLPRLEKVYTFFKKIKALGEIGLDYHYDGYSAKNRKNCL